jgi:hypothetical protein
MTEVFVLQLTDDDGGSFVVCAADSQHTAERWLFQKYNIPLGTAEKQVSNPNRVAWIGKNITAALKHAHPSGYWNTVFCTRHEVTVAADVATDNFDSVGPARLLDCEAT